MAKLEKLAGATSEIWQIFIQDSSSTTGAGLTGLVFNSSGLTAYYHRDVDTTATAITLATMTVGTFTSSGFKEIDSTNMAGWYQLCPPNAALASGAKSCAFHLKGATNMAPLPIEVQLVAVNPDDTVRFGLTALPNVASGSAGAIPTTGTGSNQISVSSGQVILQSGSGTGQLDFTSGVVKANATQWVSGTIPAVNVTGVPLVDLKYTLGTISPATAGSVGVDWAQVANKTSTVGLTGTTISTSQAITSVSGAVGSVTGAVGSLTTNNDKTGYALTSGERTSIADALLDETNGVETSWTLRQVLRIMFSALAGKLDGAATTTIHTRDQADSKNRITATVDSNGNRSATTLDAS